VTIFTPAATDKLSDSGVTVSGTAVDDVAVVLVELRVGGDAGAWLPIALSDAGGFFTSASLPAQDTAPVLIEVRAWDSLHQAGVGSVSPLLDDLPPTAQFAPGDGTYAVPRSISVVFSEPVVVLDGGLPVTLTPPAPASSWDASQRTLMLSGLDFNTFYTAQVSAGVVRDGFGHTNADTKTARFWTEPQVPTSGTLTQTTSDTVLGFDVASDLDGLVTLVVKYQPGIPGPNYFDWYRAGVDGSFSRQDEVQDTGASTVFQAVGGVVATSSGSLIHSSGFYMRQAGAPSSGAAYYVLTTSAGVQPEQTPSGATALVPMAQPCDVGDPVGEFMPLPRSVAWGTVTYPMALTPTLVAARSPEDWELLSLSDGGVDRQRFVATCAAPQVVQDAGPLTVEPQFLLDTNPYNLSAALPLSPARSLYVYSDAAHRVGTCFTCDDAGFNCTRSTEQLDTGTLLQVASANQGAWVLGAWVGPSGAVQLLKRDLTDCANTWQLVTDIPGSLGATRFKPVMVGSHMGVAFQVPGQHQVQLFWL
jgi:hypothetical protein